MLNIMYFDVCDVQYITDHCNREGEALIGVTITRDLEIARIKDELKSEIRRVLDDREDFPWHDLDYAIQCFGFTLPVRHLDRLLDSLRDDGETTMWFRLVW